MILPSPGTHGAVPGRECSSHTLRFDKCLFTSFTFDPQWVKCSAGPAGPGSALPLGQGLRQQLRLEVVAQEAMELFGLGPAQPRPRRQRRHRTAREGRERESGMGQERGIGMGQPRDGAAPGAPGARGGAAPGVWDALPGMRQPLEFGMQCPGWGSTRSSCSPPCSAAPALAAHPSSENGECQREREGGAAEGRVEAKPVSVPWAAQPGGTGMCEELRWDRRAPGRGWERLFWSSSPGRKGAGRDSLGSLSRQKRCRKEFSKQLSREERCRKEFPGQLIQRGKVQEGIP